MTPGSPSKLLSSNLESLFDDDGEDEEAAKKYLNPCEQVDIDREEEHHRDSDESTNPDHAVFLIEDSQDLGTPVQKLNGNSSSSYNGNFDRYWHSDEDLSPLEHLYTLDRLKRDPSLSYMYDFFHCKMFN